MMKDSITADHTSLAFLKEFLFARQSVDEVVNNCTSQLGNGSPKSNDNRGSGIGTTYDAQNRFSKDTFLFQIHQQARPSIRAAP